MRAEMRTDSVLALESSSRKRAGCLKIWVAALFTAATLLLCPVTAYCRTVQVDGLSRWQARLAERSLGAVAEKLPEGQPDEVTSRIIKIVSDKLFAGYKTASVTVLYGDISVKLIPEEEPPVWKTAFVMPSLQDPPLEWFRADIKKIEGPVAELMQGIPVASLSWCDAGLMDEIEKILADEMPGWKPALMVISEGEETVLKVSFTPEMPLVLAVSPRFISNSLPLLLHGELKESLMARFVPFIGIPVSWAGTHSGEINKWAETFLEERNIVTGTASVPKASFSAGQISHMDVNIESRYYTVGAWVAVYAGTENRSGELGLHLGRKARIFPHWDMELYGEGIVELQHWDTEGRLGLRWSPWGDVWLGGEWSSRDDMFWGRLSIDPRLRKPYAWIRIREDGETNTAVGWKATEYISFELHYDSRDPDAWSMRMIGNM